MDRYGEKAIFIASYPVPGDVLICSSNEMTSCMAAAVGVTTWLSLWKSTGILQDSSVFWTGQIGKSNIDVVGISSPASLKSLIIALISAIPPGGQCCFWFTIFFDRDSSNGFHLVCPTRIAFTPQVRKPMWGLCQLSMSIHNDALWKKRNNHRMSMGTHKTHCEDRS